jgi:hypothetical protein
MNAQQSRGSTDIHIYYTPSINDLLSEVAVSLFFALRYLVLGSVAVLVLALLDPEGTSSASV